MNKVTLNMYTFLLNTGFARRNTVFIFLWLRPGNTWIPIQHVGPPPTVARHSNYVPLCLFPSQVLDILMLPHHCNALHMRTAAILDVVLSDRWLFLWLALCISLSMWNLSRVVYIYIRTYSICGPQRSSTWSCRTANTVLMDEISRSLYLSFFLWNISK